jgi:hypothetical protein
MKINEILIEKWSQKYKSSINCSHPKGFSQKAHCAGKKKHNESVEMEMVCEDCGMCETHGNLNEIAKGAKDANGVTKCWPGKHAEGTKKGRNGGQVRNCVPNESQGVMEMDKSQTPPGRDGSNDPDAGKKEYTAKTTTPEKVAKHGEKILNKIFNKKKGVAEGFLNEFAPDDGSGGEEETLYKYARMWYNGDLATQQQVEKVLARMGWEIGELESEEGGAFVVQAGDENGNSYIGFSPADLTEGVAEGDNMSTFEEQGSFKHHMDRAMAAHNKGDAKEKAHHLDKATAAKHAFKAADYNDRENYQLLDQHRKMIMSKDDELAEMLKYAGVPIKEGVAEGEKHGLYYNVNKRKAAGTSRPASSPKAPTAQAWKDAAKTAKTESIEEDLEAQFDMIEDMVESLAQARGVDAEQIWEDLEAFDDETLLNESAAWHRKAGKSAKGGLNRKGVASYRAEHPGSKLQMAVTTKPSKLKHGSKAAKRRKSFCARMGGVNGPMKKPNGKPTRKALALRKWNC